MDSGALADAAGGQPQGRLDGLELRALPDVVLVQVDQLEELDVLLEGRRVRSPAEVLAGHRLPRRGAAGDRRLTAGLGGGPEDAVPLELRIAGQVPCLTSRRAVLAFTSLLLTNTQRRRPPSASLISAVACRVVPEPAKKSRIRASGRSRTTDRSTSRTAYRDLGNGEALRLPRNLWSSEVPWVPASCCVLHQTVLYFLRWVLSHEAEDLGLGR